MGAVTDAISAMKVQQWSRATVADGQWLQEKTFKQLDERDIRLANEIDSINERIPTSGSSYDGLIPWITDGDLERNPLYVITDDTGTRLQNGASGDKQFYVAPSFNDDDGKVFGIKDGKAKWIDPLEVSFIKDGTSSKVDSLQLYWKGAGQTQLKADSNFLGSTVPTPESTDEELGKVLTVTSGENGAYMDWKTAPNTVEFRTLCKYNDSGNIKSISAHYPYPSSETSFPAQNGEFFGVIGFKTNTEGPYSIVPLNSNHELIYGEQCVNLMNVPSGYDNHYNFHFNANDLAVPLSYIGIKGSPATSAADITITLLDVFYKH